MRDDMSKVIVERPRAGSRGGTDVKGRRSQLPHELQPKFEGIKKQKGGTKSLNENLAPLRRFIEKQVGRPWNKVFSEIREHVKPGNTVQEHVLSHLDNFIHRKVARVTPSKFNVCGLASQESYGVNRVRPGELYVDPNDNIIKVAKQRIFFPKKEVKKRAAIFDGPEHVLINDRGIWYSIKVARFKLESYEALIEYKGRYGKTQSFHGTKQRFVLSDGQRVDYVNDLMLGLVKHDNTYSLQQLYGDFGLYGVGTRHQLNSKELKKFRLENGEQDEAR